MSTKLVDHSQLIPAIKIDEQPPSCPRRHHLQTNIGGMVQDYGEISTATHPKPIIDHRVFQCYLYLLAADSYHQQSGIRDNEAGIGGIYATTHRSICGIQKQYGDQVFMDIQCVPCILFS